MQRAHPVILLLILLPPAIGCVTPTAVDVSSRQGLILSTSDGEAWTHVGGRAAVDGRFYDSRNARDSGLRLDEALLQGDGAVADGWRWKGVADLRGTDTRGGFEQAWVSYQRQRTVRATVGLVSMPLGIEESIPRADLSFVGQAFPAYLTGRTDLGLRVDGELQEGLFSYDVALAAGEGFDPNGDRIDHPQASARVVLYPLLDGEQTLATRPWYTGFFLSTGAAYSSSYARHLDVATPLRNKIFIVPRLEADASFFWQLGYGLDAGPVRFFHEWVRGGLQNLETPAGTKEDLDNQITAWAATLSWMVTGERYDTRPFRQRERESVVLRGPSSAEVGPRRPISWPGEQAGERTGWGALELAARYSNADLDRDFFRLGFTDYRTSSQESRTFTGAVNWYANRNLRLTAEVVRTLADQFPAVFDSHGRDTSFLFRVQYRF